MVSAQHIEQVVLDYLLSDHLIDAVDVLEMVVVVQDIEDATAPAGIKTYHVYDIVEALAASTSFGERIVETWVGRYVFVATHHVFKHMRFRFYTKRDETERLLRDPCLYFNLKNHLTVKKKALLEFATVKYDSGRDALEEMAFSARLHVGLGEFRDAVSLANYALIYRDFPQIAKTMYLRFPLSKSQQALSDLYVKDVRKAQALVLAQVLQEMQQKHVGKK